MRFAFALSLCIILQATNTPLLVSSTTDDQTLKDPISEVDTSNPSVVATTFDYRNTGYMRQRKVFRHGDTYFVFYSDDANMVYKTSQNDETWSDAVVVRPCALSARFSIWYDGAYVHYAYNPHQTDTPIYYRRGLISGSAIVWDSEQIAVPAGPWGYVYCVVAADSGGSPWIGYLDYTTYYTYVTKSSTNDGTWQTASGFPYKLTEILSNGGVSSWGSILVPLTENRVYVVYGRGGYPLNGRLWTGSNWSEEETASTSPLNNNWYAFSAVAFHDDVHVVFVTGSNLIYIKRVYSTGWTPEETVRFGSEGIDIGWLGVSLTIDARNGDMWAFFSNHQPSPNGWVKYRRYVASTRAWSQIDFDLASDRNYPMRPSASYQVQESEVCVVWTEEMSPNSNNLVFAKLETVASFFHPATEFWFTWYDLASVQVEIDNIHFVNPSDSIATINVFIAGSQVSSIIVGAGEQTYTSYRGVLGGPVRVVSDQPIWVTQRIVGWNGFKEVPGLPVDSASAEIYYTWYDMASPSASWDAIHFLNPSGTSTAHAQVYIAGVSRGTVTVEPGGAAYVTYPGVIGGPVRIVSDVPIFSTQRVIGWSDFDEIIGMPSWHVFKEHWFNWYDSVGASLDNIHFINQNSEDAYIELYIAGSLRDSFTLPAGQAAYRNFPATIGGPVRVVSDQPIWVTQRIVGWEGFKELCSVPTELMSSNWYFTWYDMAGASWDAIHFLNPSTTQTGHINVYIAGQLKNTIALNPGEASYVCYAGEINGPVQITSDIPIMATQRILGWSSFEETIGIQWT